MGDLTPAVAAILMALSGALSGFAVYWYCRFRRLLPLEVSLEELRRQAEKFRQFSVKKSREAKTLYGVAALTAQSTQAQSALAAMVSIIAKYLEADMVAFLLLDEATGELATQPGGYGLESAGLHYRVALSEDSPSSVRVFKSGQAFITGDAQKDISALSHDARLEKIHSLMAIPIKKDGHSIGVMRAGSFKRDYFTAEHLEMLSVVADEAAVIVETAVLNRKLAETAEQLGALNRIKDEFVSTVSHEFKTPLTTIKGFITVMLDGDTGKLTEQQMKFLSVARGAVSRLEQMVGELLDLSKLEGGLTMEIKPLSLEALLRASVEGHRPSAQAAGKALFYDIPGNLPLIKGDDNWLRLVVDNLISNALKFTRDGGSVRLSAVDKGDFIMVCVEDNGIGIHPDDREHIFDKFYRARNSAEISAPGTGLGLAIAKQVVAKHGGRIWFESELGRGTRFFFVVGCAARTEEVGRP